MGLCSYLLGQKDLLEKGMVAHSSILPWRSPWTEKPRRATTVHRISKNQTLLKQLRIHIFLSYWLFGLRLPALLSAGSWAELGLGAKVRTSEIPLSNIPRGLRFSANLAGQTQCSHHRSSGPTLSTGTKIMQITRCRKKIKRNRTITEDKK